MDFTRLISDLAASFKKREIGYMIIGGQAVLFYGEPRLTRDIDISLALAPTNNSEILEIVKELKLNILVDNVDDFLSQTFVLPVEDPKSGFRVDFIFSLSEYERQAIKRSKIVKLEDAEVNFISVEDLIVYKLIANRPRDLEDVKGVLIRQKDVIDFNYIDYWGKQYDIELETSIIKNLDAIKKEIS